MIINLIGFLIIPLIGIMALILNNYTKSTSQKNITIISMCSTAVLFLVGLVYGFGGFDVSLVQSLDFSFSLVTNSLSTPFILLSVFVPLIAIISLNREKSESSTIFHIFYMLAYMSAIIVFISGNLISLFLFWEVTVLSMFFIISLFGDGSNKRSAMKFLIFTQFGSLTLLGAFILVFIYTGSFSLTTLFATASSIPSIVSYTIFIFILVTALIKMPVFPLHEWLPDAYLSAPMSGTVFLSAVMSKLGGYILILFGLELFPSILHRFSIPLLILGIIAVIYMAFAASGQKNLKSMLSYSSAFYMGLVFIGIVSTSVSAVTGSVILMVSHSFIIASLFAMSSMLFSRIGTHDIYKSGGVMKRMPVLTFFFVFMVFATLGVPGLSNFVGELLIFIGSYSVFPFVLVSLVGLLVATNYYLNSVRKIFYGTLHSSLKKISDISLVEIFGLSLFSFFVILIGLYPSLIIGSFGVI